MNSLRHDVGWGGNPAQSSTLPASSELILALSQLVGSGAAQPQPQNANSAHAQASATPQQANALLAALAAQLAPKASASSLPAHLEALSFWSQLYQIAVNGLNHALQQAQSSLPGLGGTLGSLAALLPAAPAHPVLQLLQAAQSNNLSLSSSASDMAVTAMAAAGLSHPTIAAAPLAVQAQRAPVPLVPPPPAASALMPALFGSGLGPSERSGGLDQPGADMLSGFCPPGPAAATGSGGVAPPLGPGGTKDWTAVSLDVSDGSQEAQPQRKRPRKVPDESSSNGKICSNCNTNNTPFWRKDRVSGLPLCNACGLYAAKNDHPRPVKLWREGHPGPYHSPPPLPQQQQQHAQPHLSLAALQQAPPSQPMHLGQDSPTTSAAAMAAALHQAAARLHSMQQRQNSRAASPQQQGSPQSQHAAAVQQPQQPQQPQQQPAVQVVRYSPARSPATVEQEAMQLAAATMQQQQAQGPAAPAAGSPQGQAGPSAAATRTASPVANGLTAENENAQQAQQQVQQAQQQAAQQQQQKDESLFSLDVYAQAAAALFAASMNGMNGMGDHSAGAQALLSAVAASSGQ